MVRGPQRHELRGAGLATVAERGEGDEAQEADAAQAHHKGPG